MTYTLTPPWQSAAADRIADLEVALAQARDAQEVAEAAQHRADERAQAEADRADGAESLLRQVMAEYVIAPVLYSDGIDLDRVSAEDMDAIAESLIEALHAGAPVDDLGVADRIADWAHSQGGLR